MSTWGMSRQAYLLEPSYVDRYMGEKKAPEEWEEVFQVMYLVTVAMQKSMVERNLEGPH